MCINVYVSDSTIWGDGGSRGRGSVVGSNPRSACLSRWAKTLYSPCLLMVVRRHGGADCNVCTHFSQSAQGNGAYHCQCINGWMTDCSVKPFGVLELDEVLYKCRPFTI
ncbi:hypothetical protein ILYODFUR_026078 [Ilyodon furcidens]|uniref:Uncharacterized protein n=1 Tax=Ilyodon furcidens TaxID=33524 RepID=A0ABV0TY66_9TELE